MAQDWEVTFNGWAKPPGKTEQDKCGNAETAIRKAISSGYSISKRTIKVFPQGSYRHRTNVKADSDVDICIVCHDSIFFDLPGGMKPDDFNISTPAKYSYSTYKKDVEDALVSYFGKSTVRRGNKAFDIHENTYRVDADAVACFEYRRYDEDGSYIEGTSFLPDKGSRIINWPEQNYQNGVAKNDVTNRRFKSIVRILKRLRNEMVENGISKAEPIPSFLIESLVWNVPDEGFAHETLTGDVRYSLAYLFNNTRKFDACKEWGETNELKYLFRNSQPWSLKNTNEFLDVAWDYIDFE